MNGTTGPHGAAGDEKFRIIFDSVSDGIFVADAVTGAFTEVNESGCAMFGYVHDELIGRTIAILSSGTPPYTLHDAQQWLAKARTDGAQTFDWHCRAKDGHLFWGEIALRCVPFDGHEVALAIVRDVTEQKRRQDELFEQARLDELTHLPNRRDFDQTLSRELARSERYGSPLCAAMGDIDHFKRVNDKFGHPAGDAVLRRLAAYMRRNLRRIDYIARWGGEEFMILLPETQLELAEELLNRLRNHIARHTIPEIRRSVTLSFGVTEFHKPETPAALLTRVDQALYRSKQTGRNRVTAV